MDGAWMVDLHAVFDGSRRLEGGEYRRPSGAGIVIDGAPVGLGKMSFEEFLAGAGDLGIRRFSLMVLDGEDHQRGEPQLHAHPFVLVGDPIGSWRVRNVARTSTRWVYDPAEVPTRRQLDIDEATDRLRDVLNVIRHGLHDSYQSSVLQALRFLDGAPLPKGPAARTYGLSASGKRLYTAAMEIGSHKLVGMGGLTDILPMGVGPLEVVHAVAHAVAASTRS